PRTVKRKRTSRWTSLGEITARLVRAEGQNPSKGSATTVAQVAQLWAAMIAAIGHHRVGDRPDRHEPRAVRRRPKMYPRLRMTRQEAHRFMRDGGKFPGDKDQGLWKCHSLCPSVRSVPSCAAKMINEVLGVDHPLCCPLCLLRRRSLAHGDREPLGCQATVTIARLGLHQEATNCGWSPHNHPGLEINRHSRWRLNQMIGQLITVGVTGGNLVFVTF